jgi:hypothetical protein
MKIKRAASLLMILCFGFVATREAGAADTVNGWSGQSTLAEVYSLTSLSMFRLNGVANGCGHPTYWQLPLPDTVAAKTKIALITAAFMAGKQISLRCENSYVSDFQIFE